MTDAAHRVFKDRLYGQFARIGKALGSPHRLELLELLAQGERTVDALATESGLTMANASQRLVRDHFGDRSDPEAVPMKELLKTKEYVAHCRGPYCIYADRAVELLRKNGRRARRLVPPRYLGVAAGV